MPPTGFHWLRILNASPHPIAAGSRYDIALELQGPGEPYIAPWTCPLDPEIGETAAGFYGPLGGTTTDSRGNVWYTGGNAAFFPGDIGHTAFDGPNPGATCQGLGFPDYSTIGGDAAGTGVNSIIEFVFAGSGVANLSMLSYMGRHVAWGWWQYYFNATGAVLEQSDTTTLADGDSADVVVGPLPDDAVSCYRYIDLGPGAILDGGGGTKIVFPGITWTPDE